MSYEIPFGAPLGYVWIPNLPVPAHTNRFVLLSVNEIAPNTLADSADQLGYKNRQPEIAFQRIPMNDKMGRIAILHSVGNT